MHFRNNSTDFWKWCRHYVRRAKSIIKVHENINDVNYQIRNKKYYSEAKEILNQYEILKYSLSYEQNQLLEEWLINNKVKPEFSDYNATNNLKVIQYNWQKICFPQTKQKLKTIDKVKIGKALKKERLFQGLSLMYVAELINVNEVTLKSYEEGNRLVKLDVAYRLSQLYNISVDDLIACK